ncbi:MAG: peptide deformylase [Phascolarctobacterium sp.]|nr:peptide deformylase [Phascolarctobacterium sp.]
MIRAIMKDVIFLSQKAEPATKKDRTIGQDMLDTLTAHADECVGMAANMIGENKAIIVCTLGNRNILMYNPVIIRKTQPFETEEGCLSLTGLRSCTRYKEIEVVYYDEGFRKKKEKFSGWDAQIIQHECDHLAGIII